MWPCVTGLHCANYGWARVPPTPPSPLQPTLLLNPPPPPHPHPRAQPRSLPYFFPLPLVPGDFLGKRPVELYEASFISCLSVVSPPWGQEPGAFKSDLWLRRRGPWPSPPLSGRGVGHSRAWPGGTGRKSAQGHAAGRRVGAPSGAVLPPGLGLPTFSLDFPRPGPAVWAVGVSLRLTGLLIPTPCSHGLLCTRPHPCPAGGCSCCHLLF